MGVLGLLLWLGRAVAAPEDALDAVNRGYFERAEAAEAAGQRVDALSLYATLREADPTFVPAALGMGRALEGLGRAEEAEAVYRALGADADGLAALARLVEQRSPASALELYRQLQGLRAGDAAPFCAEARILVAPGASGLEPGRRVHAAQTAWERCVTLSSAAQPDLSILLRLVDALLADRTAEAEAVAVRAMEDVLARWPGAAEAEAIHARLDRLEVERSARDVVLGGGEPLSDADTALLRQARALLAAEPTQARAVAEALVERAPRSAEAHGALSDATYGLDWTSAEVHALRARDLDRDDAANHLRVARVLHAAYAGRRDDEALVAMRQAAALRPDEPEILLQLADLEGSQREWARARAALEHYLQITTDPGLTADVRSRLDALEREAPVVAPLRAASGAAGGLSGVTDEAASAWRVALVYLDRGDRQAARVELDRALALAPAVPELLNLDARLRRESGDEAGAVGAWQRSLALEPRQGDVQLALGQTLDVRGGREAALGHYRAAAALGEPDAHYFLARSAAALGDWRTVGAELAEFDAAGGPTSLYAVAAGRLAEQAERRTWTMRAAGIALVVVGLGVPGVLAWRRRSAADLRRMLDAAPTSWHDAARILAAVRHEVLKHNTTVLPDIAYALDRGDRGPWDAWRPGAAALLTRFDGYIAALVAVGEQHGVRLAAQHDPVLAPMRGALRALVRASRRSRPPRAAELRAHSEALNGAGYAALGTLVNEICILPITRTLVERVYARVAAEPGFGGSAAAFTLEGSAGQVRLFQGDLEDILANLFRNALAAGASAVHVALDEDSDPITGHTWFELRVVDDAPGQLTTAMIRSRYISRGLGLAVDLLNRHGGTIRVEPVPVPEGAPARKAVVVQLPAVEAAPVEVEWR